VGFGSKKAGGKIEDRQKAQQEIIKGTARKLTALPLEAQESLAQKAAEYIVRQPELRMVDWDPTKLQLEIMKVITEEKTKITDQEEIVNSKDVNAAKTLNLAPQSSSSRQEPSHMKYTKFFDTQREQKTSDPGLVGATR
jgi:hypothetical protein